MRYTEAEWHEIHAKRAAGEPSQAMKNLMLFLTHSRVWIEQLQLTKVLDAEKGIVGIREDPIDIEKLMERKILSLWNKLTPQNTDAIQKQLEALPLAITTERLRGMCDRFIQTLQVNHAYAGVYMRVLSQIEKHGAWKDTNGQKMTDVLLPLILDKLVPFRAPDAMKTWIAATVGEIPADGDERFEWEQKWKRNYQALLKMVLYGMIHRMWGEGIWAKTQEASLCASATEGDVEAWLQVYQAWRKDGAQGGGRWWRGARALLKGWHERLSSGRMRFLIDDVLAVL